MALSPSRPNKGKTASRDEARSIHSGASSTTADMLRVEVLRDGFYGGIYYQKGMTIDMVAKTAAQFLPPLGNQLKKA